MAYSRFKREYLQDLYAVKRLLSAGVDVKGLSSVPQVQAMIDSLTGDPANLESGDVDTRLTNAQAVTATAAGVSLSDRDALIFGVRMARHILSKASDFDDLVADGDTNLAPLQAALALLPAGAVTDEDLATAVTAELTPPG